VLVSQVFTYLPIWPRGQTPSVITSSPPDDSDVLDDVESDDISISSPSDRGRALSITASVSHTSHLSTESNPDFDDERQPRSWQAFGPGARHAQAGSQVLDAPASRSVASTERPTQGSASSRNTSVMLEEEEVLANTF
jgi:hypothetical protein